MKKILITLTTFGLSTGAFAQNELTGNWALQSQESVSGKLYSNGSPKSVKIISEGNSISFEKVMSGAAGQNVTISETVGMDGKLFETKSVSGKKKVITMKKEGDSWIEKSFFYNAVDSAKIDHKDTDTWRVANGQLLLDRKDENLLNGEVWESKAIYTKE